MERKPHISSFTAIVTFICLAIVGIVLIPLLPVKLSPSYTLPELTVYYNMPDHSARVIEMEVTSRLEAMLARIKGIKAIRSTSRNGRGTVTITFDKHTNIDAARFEASTIIRQTWPSLPDKLSYPFLEMLRPDENESRPFITYTLNAAATPIFIQQFAENQIKPRLVSIPGIYRIDVSGATPMEWRLEYDNRQLSTLGITIQDIQQAINLHYNKEFLGIANLKEGEDEWIRLSLVPGTDRRTDRNTGTNAGKNIFEPAAISVLTKENQVIRLDKLLKVTRQEEEPRSYYRINGLNSIYLSIRADETANQLQLAQKIKEEMEHIKALLPAGYEMHVGYDATGYIQDELNKIYIRTALTVLILLLFVWMITRNFRYLLLIVISLSVNLCIAAILYYLLGLEMQLYSLAGVTISLSLMIDNTIVMTEHIKRHRNRNAFLPILAATATTIGALSVIFFLDEKIRLSLQDFTAVVIINLAVSLFIALFFVPALIDRMKLFTTHLLKKSESPNTLHGSQIRTTQQHLLQRFGRWVRNFRRRFPIYFSRYYAWQINFIYRWKKSFCTLLILAFGLPVFMLSDFIEQHTSDTTYKEYVKPILEKALGGTLRLFVQDVYNGSYFTDRQEIILTTTASMPNGTTLNQMNNLISRMETYLSTYKEIRQFQTSIYNARQARIEIFFTKEKEHSGFPYTLKNKIVGKALELGGGSWGVYGLPADRGFSNDVRESAGNYRIEMLGYNYDELYEWAEQLRGTLLTYPRIKEVLINSEYSWFKDDYQEFYFKLNKARMAQENIRPQELFASIHPIFGKDMNVGSIVVDNELEKLKLNSRQAKDYDIWSVQYVPQTINDVPYKLSELATIEKGQIPQEVRKFNQQYRLCLQYEYIGASKQGEKIQEQILKDFNATVPMGYSAKSESFSWRWGKEFNNQYLLLGLIIVIIFFTTAILFNSLRQPLAVIFVIPISYIGVFLTFYWFRLNFDQGGFASLILLCGITVNASIYILNEYNKIRQQKPLLSPNRAYLKAWNAKITPIFLTVISTILGFIPFMLGDEKEAFWFPLAAGTIGGLVSSLIALFCFLPLFMGIKINPPS